MFKFFIILLLQSLFYTCVNAAGSEMYFLSNQEKLHFNSEDVVCVSVYESEDRNYFPDKREVFDVSYLLSFAKQKELSIFTKKNIGNDFALFIDDVQIFNVKLITDKLVSDNSTRIIYRNKEMAELLKSAFSGDEEKERTKEISKI